MLFALWDDWLKQRLLLAGLGVKVEQMEILDELAAGYARPGDEPPATDPADRRAQVAAFAAASGGEVVDG